MWNACIFKPDKMRKWILCILVWKYYDRHAFSCFAQPGSRFISRMQIDLEVAKVEATIELPAPCSSLSTLSDLSGTNLQKDSVHVLVTYGKHSMV
jgi:hypothetical protein